MAARRKGFNSRAAQYMAGDYALRTLAKTLKYGTGPAMAYAARNYKYGSGPPKRGLSGQGFSPSSSRGGAAPIASGYSRKQFRKNRAKLRKKYKPRSNAKLTRDVARLKATQKQLKYSDEASNGTMTYRLHTSHQLSAADNVQNSIGYDGWSVANMETALANLKYYDPSNPATLITADATVGGFNKQVHFKSLTTTLHIRNNYQSDCDLVVYLCKPRDDTSIQPTTAWSNGATDGANVAITDTSLYPNDFKQFRDLWTAKRVQSSILSPGQTVKVSHSVKDIMYDPSTVDEHNLTYQKYYGNFVFLVLIKGVISHDSSLVTQRGLQACGIDILRKRTAIVNYDAGIGLEYVHADTSGFNTPTNGFVQSHQPIPDNVSYSVA